jgi:hypothetical protein
MSLTLSFTGKGELAAALRARGDQALPVAARALFEEAEAIMADSKEHFVPVDVAALKTSGHVQLPTKDADGVSVTMGYGGAAKDYAIVQHERMDFQHTVGGPKYLERPLLKAARGLPGRLASRIRELFT